MVPEWPKGDSQGDLKKVPIFLIGPRREKSRKEPKMEHGISLKSEFFRVPGPRPVPDLILGGFWRGLGAPNGHRNRSKLRKIMKKGGSQRTLRFLVFWESFLMVSETRGPLI